MKLSSKMLVLVVCLVTFSAICYSDEYSRYNEIKECVALLKLKWTPAQMKKP